MIPVSGGTEASLAMLGGEDWDVVIVGGGLAGLTCALHLRRAHPHLRVALVNKRRGPAREAAFKVGESVSEVGSHYFTQVLGLGDHIRDRQAAKFGLRVFFPTADNTRIEHRVEVGPPGDEAARRLDQPGVLPTTPVPTFQLDRGRFENELWERNLAAGTTMVSGSRVTGIRLGETRHEIDVQRDEESGVLRARWVVDASGRGRFLQRQLGLEQPNEHCINAAWLRLRGGMDVEAWSEDPQWRSRLPAGLRCYSTNHLLGRGYWVWIIQLGSGPASIGVVADPRHHPMENFAEIETALEWMRTHEPQLATAIEARRDEVMDYLSVVDFSYGCERVFSPARWCLVGEAGLFLDPLYSPGSDFIAFGNTMAVSLIGRDLAGLAQPGDTEYLNGFYLRLYQGLLPVYLDQYGLLGNPEVGAAKVLWNNLTYWGTLCLLFFNGRMADVPFLRSIEADLDRFFELLRRVEGLFREWDGLGSTAVRDAYLCGKGPLVRYYVDLQRSHPDPDRLLRRIRRNLEHMEAIALSMFAHAASRLPEGAPDDGATLNPRGIGLEPGRWDEDGLFDDDGISLSVAKRKAGGLRDYLAPVAATNGGRPSGGDTQ